MWGGAPRGLEGAPCETAMDACHTECALIDATSPSLQVDRGTCTPPGASGSSSSTGLPGRGCPTRSTRPASPTCAPPAVPVLGELRRRRYRRRLDDPQRNGTLLTPSPLTFGGCCR